MKALCVVSTIQKAKEKVKRLKQAQLSLWWTGNMISVIQVE